MSILSSHTSQTLHAPSSVFACWAEPESWPTWDEDVREVRFSGEVRVGAQGWMRPASGPATTFTISVVEQDHIFTSTSSLPGAKLIFEHIVEPAPGGSRVFVTISVNGPMRGVWKLLLGRTFASAAERNVRGLLEHLDGK